MSWRAQVNIARDRGAGLVIAILVLSGGATVAGQSYAVLEAVRLGFAPKWLAPSVLLGVPAAALTPRFAERSQRQTMLVIIALAAAGFLAGAGSGLFSDSREIRICGVISAFVLIQISAAAIWSAGQIIARPQRTPGEQHAEGAIRQAAPSAGQAVIGLGLLPLWLADGWSAICPHRTRVDHRQHRPGTPEQPTARAPPAARLLLRSQTDRATASLMLPWLAGRDRTRTGAVARPLSLPVTTDTPSAQRPAPVTGPPGVCGRCAFRRRPVGSTDERRKDWTGTRARDGTGSVLQRIDRPRNCSDVVQAREPACGPKAQSTTDRMERRRICLLLPKPWMV